MHHHPIQGFISSPNIVPIQGAFATQIGIQIINSQNVATPGPFQQMLQLSISQLQAFTLLANDFHNVRFAYNGNYIPAWLESINNGIATIWVLIPSIAANSSITIEMQVLPWLNFDGNYWGEAPQLSPTYAEYDNGASVFNNYWNFAGTSLPSGLSASGGLIYTVNNGLTIVGEQSGYNWGVIATTVPINLNEGAFSLMNFGNNGVGRMGSSFTNPASYTPNQYYIHGSAGSDYYLYTYYSNPSYTPFQVNSNIAGSSTFVFIMMGWYSKGGYFTPYMLLNNNMWTLSTNISLPSAQSSFYLGGSDITTNQTVQYFGTYNFPPNGVMPSVEVMV